MANTIKLKRGTSTPSTSDIASGEVAIDTSAQKLYINDSGTVKEIGGGSSIGGDTGVDFNDSVKVRFGTGNDLEIFHNGTNSHIDNHTGDLNIRGGGGDIILSPVDGEFAVYAIANNKVQLRYDNSTKLETSSTGITVTGEASLTGGVIHLGTADSSSGHINAYENMTFNIDTDNDDTSRYFAFYKNGNTGNGTELFKILEDNNIQIPNDSAQLQLGASQDLQIFHNGTDSVIYNATGDLDLRSNGTISLQASDGSEIYGNFVKDAEVALYYDNVVKLQTQSWGVLINDQLKLTDSKSLFIGDGNDFQIYHDGSNTHLENVTGVLNLRNSANIVLAKAHAETLAVFTPDGANELYYDNSKKLETSSTGTTITGQSLVDIGTSLNSATNYSGENFGLLVNSNQGNNNGNEGNGICFAQRWDASDGTKIRTGAVIGFKDAGTGTFGGGLKLKVQQAGATPLLTALTLKANGDVRLPADSQKLQLGGSQDLQIYHDGSNSSIQNATGKLYLYGGSNQVLIKAVNAETSLAAKPNGAVELYYDNALKLETLTAGVQVWGHLRIPDSDGTTDKLEIGNGQDLTLYHDGTNSYIDNDTGALFIQAAAIVLEATNGENYVKGTANGAAELYYDNSKKVETSANGLDFGDVVKASFGDGGDLTIYHNGTNSYLDNGTGDLYLRPQSDIYWQNLTSNDVYIKGINNGAVEIYYDGNKKAETVTGGFTVTGTCTATAFAGDGSSLTGISASDSTKLPLAGGTLTGNVIHNDNVKALFGTGSDLQIYHNGSHSYIDNGTGDTYVRPDGLFYIIDKTNSEVRFVARDEGNVELYYDNSKKIDTNSGGVKVYGNIDIDDNNKLRVGTSSDLQIYHDGTSNIILANSGDLNIRTNNEENSIVARQNGSAELYYDNGKRFETISNGVRILGAEGGNANLQFYADEGDDNGDKWQMYASDAGGFIAIKNYASGSWETSIECNNNGNVEIYYDNAKRLETTSSGITIPNTLTVSDGANIDGDIKFKGSGDGDDFFWDKSADQLTLTDSRKIRFGDSGDLEIYHDGSDSYIKDAGTGILVLQTNYLRVNNAAGNETIINAAENGSVDLYYDNSKKLETAANGVLVSGYIDIENGHLYLRDSYKAQFGASQDLQIFHDGTNSNINNSTGTLKIGCSNNIEINTFDGHAAAKFINDGAVELYHNNALKFATTSNGVNVSDESGAVHLRLYTGTSTIRGYLYADDSNRIYLLDAQGHATFKGVKDGAAELYYDNSKKLNTHTDGVEVLGKLYMADNKNIELGNSQDLKILHDSSGDSYIQDKGSGNLYITGDDIIIQNNDTSENIAKFIENSYVSFYFDNSQKFYTQSYGCVCAGDFKPESNNTYNLGDSSYRWANLYVNDMHFSNEGKSNSVDGTWGDWTLQEGDENIFMINNRTGKKYKMGLQEVN